MWNVFSCTDEQLSATHHRAIRALLDAAFAGDLSDDDADHAAGGLRVLVSVGERIIGHAALIARQMTIDGRALTVGYIEGVAVIPDMQGKGVGRALMERTTALAKEHFPVAMLSTGEHDFYAKFGWKRCAGESFVDNHGTIERTIDEDDGLMVLSDDPAVHRPGIAFVCDWRSGDVW